MLTLYSMKNCPYCELMKSMLDETSHEYDIIDVTENKDALAFIREQNHKTVPQLYYNNIHINKKDDTRQYTSGELNDIISDVIDHQTWPGIDGGIEHGI